MDYNLFEFKRISQTYVSFILQIAKFLFTFHLIRLLSLSVFFISNFKHLIDFLWNQSMFGTSSNYDFVTLIWYQWCYCFSIYSMGLRTTKPHIESILLWCARNLSRKVRKRRREKQLKINSINAIYFPHFSTWSHTLWFILWSLSLFFVARRMELTKIKHIPIRRNGSLNANSNTYHRK